MLIQLVFLVSNMSETIDQCFVHSPKIFTVILEETNQKTFTFQKLKTLKCGALFLIFCVGNWFHYSFLIFFDCSFHSDGSIHFGNRLLLFNQKDHVISRVKFK